MSEQENRELGESVIRPHSENARASTSRIRPPLPAARKIQIGVVLVLGVSAAALRLTSLIIGYRHSTTPSAEGYHDRGTVRGTTFWIRPDGRDEFSVRTTGRYGCSYSGPDLGPKLAAVFGANGYLQLCDGGGLTGARLIAYLVPDTYGPATVQLSDGTSAEQAGSIDPGAELPSQRIDVVIIPDASTSVLSTSFG